MSRASIMPIGPEVLLLEDRTFYVYALLDFEVPGPFLYKNLSYTFEYLPIYIGKGVGRRNLRHFSVRRLQKDTNRLKANKILKIKEKTGKWPLTIKVKENLTMQESFDFEKYCISQIGRRDKQVGPLTNLTDGGEGVAGYRHTEEDRRKQSEALKNSGKVKGINNPMFGVHRWGVDSPHFGHHASQETKDKISKANLGKKRSEEYVKKLRLKYKGEGNPNFGKGDKIRGNKHYGWVTLTNDQIATIIELYNVNKLDIKTISKILSITGHVVKRTVIEKFGEVRATHEKQKIIYNKELDLMSKIDESAFLPPGFVFAVRPVSEETRAKLIRAQEIRRIKDILMLKEVSMSPLVSICIPAYEMQGHGEEMLKQLLNSIDQQTFKNYEIVVSDHSVDDKLLELCKKNPKIVYIKNTEHRGSSSQNINKAVDNSRGLFIKPMFQDDLFFNEKSLEEMVKVQESFNSDWVACGCLHYKNSIKELFYNHPATWINPEKLALGNNSIGSPSCILYKNCHLRFDEELLWLMDCDFYYSLSRKCGSPAIMHSTGIVNRIWESSVTNSLVTEQLKHNEYIWVREKWKIV